MRTIWHIFRDDIRFATKSAISVFIIAGLVFLPVMYAWFNTAASWDPYHNTHGLRVAVVNNDEGYKSDLVPLKVSLGDTVVSSLRANDSFTWDFVDEDTAMQGVNAGKYYAALEIPSSFSADLMSLFSDDVEHSNILYYTNEKENPIAPHITDAGASTIQETIRQEFTSTVSEVAVSVSKDVLDFASSDQVKHYVDRMVQTVDLAQQDLQTVEGQLRSFTQIIHATQGLVDASGSVLASTNGVIDTTSSVAQTTKQSIAEGNTNITSAQDALAEALGQSKDSFEKLKEDANTAFDDSVTSVEDAKSLLEQFSSHITTSASSYREFADALEVLNVQGALDPTVSQLGRVADAQDTLAQELTDAAHRIGSQSEEARQAHDALQNRIDQAAQELDTFTVSYGSDFDEALSDLLASLSTLDSDASGIAQSLRDTNDTLSQASSSLSERLETSYGSLIKTADQLHDSAGYLAEVSDRLSTALLTGDTEQIKAILSNDAGDLSQYLAAPISMDRHAMYPVENNGTSMSSFYTMLTLWVGAVIMVVMLEVNLGEARRAQYEHIRPHQEYFGRFGIFSLMGLGQSLLVSLGNLFFLQIQCAHPWLYVATCVVVGQIFCFFVYTLVLSFGNVGKAISVILLVMQVAGSGGIFPIEMSDTIFQEIYPWLPFMHGMRALQACVAGIYGNEVIAGITAVSSLVAIALVLGLVVRRPIVRFNTWVHHQLARTKLM